MNKLLTAALLATVIASPLAFAEQPTATTPAAATKTAPAAPKAPSEADMMAAFAKMQLAQYDTNHDGKISETEFLAPGKEMFAKMDKSHDGSVSLAEVTDTLRERVAEQKKMMEQRRAEMEKMQEAAKAKDAAPHIEHPIVKSVPEAAKH